MIGLRTAAVIAAWALSLPVDAITPCDGQSSGTVERIPIRPGLDIDIEVPAHSKGLLIEEFGADLQVRSAPDAEFVEIAVRPQRLGLAAVRARSKSITVRSNPAQAAALVIVRTRCAQEDDLVFFESLQRRFADQIEAGAAKSIEALPQIEQALAATTNPLRRAWLLHTLANAKLSAGQHEQSAELFANTRTAWQAAAEPARAAVALMAVGEDRSRAGKYDDADTALRAAESELKTVGLSYFELRARTQQCLILSRRGNPKDSVACESAVAERYEAMGEMAAAGANGISIANLWMKIGDLKRARERLIAVDKYGESLLPVTRAKLNAAFGTYYLQTGELDNAVRELQAASTRMGELGQPADQANIDLKLAGAAQQAGAYDEELRLLERSLKLIGDSGPPDMRSAIAIRAANAYLTQGKIDEAARHLATAEAICAQLNKTDCREKILQAHVLLWLQTNEYEKVHQALATTPTLALAGSVVPNQLRVARLQLADSHPETALAQLNAMPREFADPDLDLTYALLRGQALVASGQRQLATQWLREVLARMVEQTLAVDATALRASARFRIARLQSALFDLVDIDPNSRVLPSALDTLLEVIDKGNPIRLLSTERAQSRLSDSLRPQLSSAVASGTPVDQRQLFLALAASPSKPSAARSPVPKQESQSAHGAKESDSPALLLMPLAGETQFRLIALNNDGARQCLTMPRAEYDELTLRFEAALDGRSNEIAELNGAAQRWYDAVLACKPEPSTRWDIVTNAGSRSVPWAWIAASAEARSQAEPIVSIQFDTRQAIARTLRPSAAEVLNLDLSGDAALPFAATEASKVAAEFMKAGVPTQSSAGTEITVESLFANMSVPGAWVHVIGHGNSPSYGSLYAGLWLPRPAGPSLVPFPEIASAHLRADLVVLSACGDAKNDRAYTGSRLRIAEALLAAGVGNVVASSNAVSDAAAAFWTPVFYRELVAHGDASVAAREARKVLRKTPHFRDPKYWAGIEEYVVAR